MTLGVLAADPAASDLAPLGAPRARRLAVAARPPDALRDDPVTRAEDRVEAAPSARCPAGVHVQGRDHARPSRPPKTKQWTTDDLNLWSQPGDKAKQLGELDAGKKVLVTGREMWGRTEIVLKGEARWVTDGYLVRREAAGRSARRLSMAPCPDGGVESGLTDNAVYVYRSVCNAFPDITSYGGWSGHGEHSARQGRRHHGQRRRAASAIAEFLRENYAAELGPLRRHLAPAASGRRSAPARAGAGMPNRGSATANHYDHVHVSVY